MPTTSHDAQRGVRGSVVILGADACLAALPATSTQLVNACFAFGYDDVIPASWGDELLAVGCLDQLAARDGRPAMACICPLVREQLRGATEVGDAAVRLVSPPVAAALYVRATARAPQRITYVGDCPGAGHPSIDIHLSPSQFLTLLAERGIVPGSQRPVPNDAGHAVRDRRRHYSLPGGVPAPEWLASEGIERTLVDLGDLASVDPAAHGGRTLIDLAPRLGCVCSGALAGCAAHDARTAVMLHEPPRSTKEVVDHAVIVSVADETPARTMPHSRDMSWPAFVSALGGVWGGGSAGGLTAPAPRPAQAQPATAPCAPARVPVTRPVTRPRVPKRLGEEGRILPRAYQTRRAAPRPGAAAADPAGDIAPRGERLTPAPIPAYAPAWAGRRPTPAGVPRTPAVREVRTRLASADRWLLSGLVCAGSVLVAMLTSSLTVRGMHGTPDYASASIPARVETVFVAVAPKEPATERVASAPPPAADSAVTHPVAAVADAPPKAARPATAVVRPAHARPTLLAEHRHKSVPNATAPPAQTSPPVAAKPAAQPPAQPATQPAAQAPAQTPPPVATSAANTPPAAQPQAHDSAAASNAQVLQELREIRNEIEARKHHVDSLTRALDSLKKPDPPR